MRKRTILAIGLLFAWSFPPVAAAQPAGKPSLGAYVPAGVQFFTATQMTRERVRLVQPYCRAIRDLLDSGIGEDLFDLATEDISEGERSEARAVAAHVLDLVTTPQWKELVKQEISFAFRIKGPLPLPEYLLLFRVKKGTASERLGEFKQLFAGIEQLSQGALLLGNSKKKGAELVRLEVPNSPIALSAAARGDVVALCTSDLLLDEALGLMSGEPGARSVLEDGRFQAAFKGLDGPGGSRAYFNIEKYVEFFTSMVAFGEGATHNKPRLQGVLVVAKTVLGELGRLGVLASRDTVEGRRVVTRAKLSFTGGDDVGFIEGLVRDQEPLEDVVRIIPKNAQAFYFTSGIDLERVYEAILSLIEENVPGGDRILRQWKSIQERARFNVQEDLLAWLDGGWGWISLPPQGGRRCPDCVLFLRLKDSERAREVLSSLYENVRGFLAHRGQEMELVEMPESDGKLHELHIAAFPWLRPVFGLPGNVLLVGSSASAARRVAATFKGEAQDFTRNRAYKSLQIPAGPLVEIWYADVEDQLEGLANLVSGAGFLASVAPAARRDRRKLRKVGAILTKLAAFLRDVDLAVEYGGWCRYASGEHAIFSRNMTRLKAPKRK